MKRTPPYYWLIGLAGVFVIAGLVLFGLRIFTMTAKEGAPVEPHTINGDSALFDLWYTGGAIYDLSVDRHVNTILFSSSNNKAILLNRERKLQWEKSFSSEPLQAKISPCGNYLAVGTASGKLFFMSTDQKLWWEDEGDDPVYRVAMSANGEWVAAGRGDPELTDHFLELFSRDGTLQWSLDTGPLLNIYLTGEYSEQGRIVYSALEDSVVITAAVDLEGNLLWSHEGVALAATSRTGNRIAAVHGEKVLIYGLSGQLLWERALPFPVQKVTFNSYNNSILLYGAGDESGNNLFSFSADGELLWKERIADGALFSFTPDGSHIITSSWRHYKDDYSQMVLYNQAGLELKRWDVAMRVDHLVVAGNRRYVVLGGEDGYIETIDLEGEYGPGEDWASPAAQYYNPVVYGGEQRRVTMYFSGESEFMVPISRSISQTENQLRAAVEGLIRGPSRDSFLYRTLPKDEEVTVRFMEDEGQLFINISPELAAMAGTAQSIAALESLLLTLGGFLEVREVYLTVDHEQVEIFGDGLVLDQPLSPYRWKQPVFVPALMGERYYMVPWEARDLQIEQRDLDGLLRAVLRVCRDFYFVPGDLRLLDVEATTDKVKINLSDSFRQLFPPGADENERLQVSLLLDALFLTTLENSTARRIEVLVGGESWLPPEGYPDLERSFLQPYFINPE